MAVELTRPGAFGYALLYWSTSCPANADVATGLVAQLCTLAKPVRCPAHSNAHRRGNVMVNDQVVREQLLAMLRGGQAFMPFDQAVADFPAAHMNDFPPHVSYTPWESFG